MITTSPSSRGNTVVKAEHLFEHCADVLANATHRVEVYGPILEDEAESIFKKFIGSRKATLN